MGESDEGGHEDRDRDFGPQSSTKIVSESTITEASNTAKWPTQYLAVLVPLLEEWLVGTHALDNLAGDMFLSIQRQGYATGLCRGTPTIASN
jgi:hypothetical protein